MASVILGAAFQFGLHGRAMGTAFHPLAALVMFGNRGVSISLGVVESENMFPLHGMSYNGAVNTYAALNKHLVLVCS